MVGWLLRNVDEASMRLIKLLLMYMRCYQDPALRIVVQALWT